MVSVSGGSIGCHAFYDVLENVLRNSAKYGVGQDALEVHIEVEDKDDLADDTAGRRQARDHLEVHIEVEDKDDRYLITLWDNLSPQDGSDRVGRMQKRLKEEIIDKDTGEFKAESYGIHEIKHCARMLVHPYEDRLFVHVNDEKYHIWAIEKENDGNKYLAYQFILQKPRLLALVNPTESGASQDWFEAEKIGVYKVSDREQLLQHAYQIAAVFVDEDMGENVLQFIGKHHRELPYRLLLIAQQLVNLEDYGIPRSRVHVCRPDEIQLPRNTPDKQQAESLLVQVYELWLKKFKPRDKDQKWQLVVAFEREKGHCCFTLWQERLEQLQSDVVDVHLIRTWPSSSTGACVQWSSTNLNSDGLGRQIRNCPGSHIVFDNHGTLLRALNHSNIRPQLACYHEIGANNLKIYQALESPPPSGFPFKWFVIGLVEAALTDILVLDERIAESTLNDNGFNITLRNFRQAGCYVTYSVQKTESQNREFISDRIGAWNESCDLIPNDEGLWLGDASARAMVVLDPYDSLTCDRKVEIAKADFIVLHQGVVDRLHNRGRWEESALEKLYGMAPSVVITSGRGKMVRHLPSDMPFLEFSILKDNLYPQLSKYHLMRAMFSTQGRKEP